MPLHLNIVNPSTSVHPPTPSEAHPSQAQATGAGKALKFHSPCSFQSLWWENKRTKAQKKLVTARGCQFCVTKPSLESEWQIPRAIQDREHFVGSTFLKKFGTPLLCEEFWGVSELFTSAWGGSIPWSLCHSVYIRCKYEIWECAKVWCGEGQHFQQAAVPTCSPLVCLPLACLVYPVKQTCMHWKPFRKCMSLHVDKKAIQTVLCTV